MGKNYKEQAEYDYCHFDKKIKKKLLQSIENKFARHNCDWDEERAMRVEKREKQSKKDFNDELNSL